MFDNYLTFVILCLFLPKDMKMVPVPEKAFGNFFEGDCYVVLFVRTPIYYSAFSLEDALVISVRLAQSLDV